MKTISLGRLPPPSTGQIPHRLLQILITRMRIRRPRGQVAVAGESLGKEKISGCPVQVRDGAVAQGMKPKKPIKSGFSLPGFEDVLRPSLR